MTALVTGGLLAVGTLLAVAAPASAATPTPTPVPTTSSSTVVTASATCVVDDATACVRGTLKDDNGNPVKGVEVSLAGASGASASAVTNGDGVYGFKVRKAGPYKITLNTATLPTGVKAAAPSRTITATLGQLQPAIFALTGAPKGSKSSSPGAGGSGLLTQIWEQIGTGLLLGLLLALASIGLSLIYGTTGLSNFAHAEQVTLGGILAYVFGIQLGLPFLLACVVTVAVCAATGYVQDRLIWAPLRRRGTGLTQLMVVTIGLSLALEYLYQYTVGAEVHQVSNQIQLNTGPLGITPNAYLSMLIAIVVLVAVGLALQRTRIGRATRAVSDNRALAAASGIDVDRIIRLVWTVAMGLAGLSGILYALVYGGVSWATGQALLLLLFASVTLGGLGTAFGALVGSIVIGLVVQLSSIFLSSDLRYASALLILILVLIFRPQGILGRRERVG
ncbi:MAG TPA: branched-chain amino acid ABC transporter permease [Amnibacterium sp.]|uniref:branched-chain amino acid ABC transporter permease n=1 Tax=Amnibacterium sp. TaxID=1872496 RepID=UPI002F95E358